MMDRRQAGGVETGRRGVIGALAALMALPAWAARPLPVHAARIWWPGPGGGRLHGWMAIPPRDRGRQPAVLVIGDGDGLDAVAVAAARTIAATGLIACTVDLAAGGARDEARRRADLAATLHWLATNAYATGRVGAIGFGRGAARLAALIEGGDASLAAAVLYAPVAPVGAGGLPIALEPPVAPGTPGWQTSLADAVAFLKLRLAAPPAGGVGRSIDAVTPGSSRSPPLPK